MERWGAGPTRRSKRRRIEYTSTDGKEMRPTVETRAKDAEARSFKHMRRKGEISISLLFD